jgi:hypothetical protein
MNPPIGFFDFTIQMLFNDKVRHLYKFFIIHFISGG